MARSHDKNEKDDKDKTPQGYEDQKPKENVDHGHGGHGGYDQPLFPGCPVPPPPYCEVLEAEASPEGCGSLAVHVIEVRGDGTSFGISGALVALEAKGIRSREVTGADGWARWDKLSPGRYQIDVEPPTGYQPPKEKPAPITLKQGEHAEVEVPLPALQATVQVFTYHDVNGSGDPRTQPRVNNVQVTCHQGGSMRGCAHTTHDGGGEFVVDPGVVMLDVPPTILVNGRELRSATRGPVRLSVEAGERRTVYLGFETGHASLEVSAEFVTCDAEGEEQVAPLSGVSVQVFEGTRAVGAPFRTRSVPCRLDDLPNGAYTVRVIPPTTAFGQGIELFDPQQSTVHLELSSPGVSERLALRFRPACGMVTGLVLGQGQRQGIAGVRLRLVPVGGGPALQTRSNPGGDFVFNEVSLGAWDLELADLKVPGPDGHLWVPAPGSPARQRVSVLSQRPLGVAPFLLAPEEHQLSVLVLGPEGKPMPSALVRVVDEQNQLLGQYPTNEKGEVEVTLANAGTYQVSLAMNALGLPIEAPRSIYINEPGRLVLHTTAGALGSPRNLASFGQGAPRSGGPVDVDIAYPILTESAHAPTASSFAGGGGGAGNDLGQSVWSTINSVLGWKRRGLKTDGKAFLSALNQAFTLKEVEGHTEFSWTPRTYAVQPDMGAVTGAQASIFTRAKVALEQSLPLLEGLTPLNADADSENNDATRAIVRSGLTELVNELGIEGGPRVPRVDSLFRQLLGNAPSSNPEQVQGQLGQLAARFGLRRDQVNTIEEEQNLTNFLIVVEYMLSLFQSWTNQRDVFSRTGGTEPFLGTQLVHVSRSLAVVSESVQEVYAALDSVFIGPAERQVLELNYPAPQPSLFLAELLSWVDEAASEEGPRLIREGGKAGVVAFTDTLLQLVQLVRGALIPPQLPNQLPAGYRTARVQRALQELASHLDETHQLASQIQAAA